MISDKAGFRTPIIKDRLKQLAIASIECANTALYSRIQAMSMVRDLRSVVLQLGLYCLIVAGAIGVTLNGSKLLLDIIAGQMFQMGYEVALQNLPKQIETANFRPFVE